MVNGHRLQGLLLPYCNKPTVQEIPAFLCPWSILPNQSSAVWSVHCSNGIHNSSQGGQTDASKQGHKIHQYLDDWLARVTSHKTCLHHTQTLVAMCQELDWIVDMEN